MKLLTFIRQLYTLHVLALNFTVVMVVDFVTDNVISIAIFSFLAFLAIVVDVVVSFAQPVFRINFYLFVICIAFFSSVVSDCLRAAVLLTPKLNLFCVVCCVYLFCLYALSQF